VDAPRVKICGLTELEDAQHAVELGAWALGMIFYRRSPRRCRVAAAERIAAALRRQAELVGVFVNAPLDEVVSTADRVGLTMLQLHGDEGPSFCQQAAHRTGCRVIKATQVRSAADIAGLRRFRSVDYVLLDGHGRGLRGGTGETFDWDLIAGKRAPKPVILSGGLRPENVAEAIVATHPFAVDVASGIESEPGRKDLRRMEDFFAAVKGAAAEAAA
jgi:phosphoribosylanthranilate isomerase